MRINSDPRKFWVHLSVRSGQHYMFKYISAFPPFLRHELINFVFSSPTPGWSMTKQSGILRYDSIFGIFSENPSADLLAEDHVWPSLLAGTKPTVDNSMKLALLSCTVLFAARSCAFVVPSGSATAFASSASVTPTHR